MMASKPRAGCTVFPGNSPLRLVLLACLLALNPFVRAAEFSEAAPLAPKSLLLSLARAGSRVVAVGDRGHVLLSDDEGRTWRQVIVPTRAMLTGVAFGDNQHGWAVGHDGVILATSDGGNTWIRQKPEESIETVFLAVHFKDARQGWAVGAYGKCLVTTDAGDHWQDQRFSDSEVHFNQLAAGPDGTLYLPGESGTLLVSRDAGASWQPLSVPYDGSLYGLLPLTSDQLLVYGLRGHIFISDDAGAVWAPRETKVPVLLMAGIKMPSGVIVVAGQGGNFNVSRDGGATFAPWKPAEYNGGVSALLPTLDGELLVAGELGLHRLSIPQGPTP